MSSSYMLLFFMNVLGYGEFVHISANDRLLEIEQYDSFFAADAVCCSPTSHVFHEIVHYVKNNVSY